MPNYWTNCFDNDRTGWNPEEVILTPDEIRKSFGLLYTYQVTGPKPPQTLDLVFVATEDSFIYAFDAEQNTQIWQRQLLPVPPAPTEHLITPTDVNCDDVEPHYGITCTPVIDVAAGTMYVVA